MTSRTTSSTAVTEPRHVYWLPAVAILAIAALIGPGWLPVSF